MRNSVSKALPLALAVLLAMSGAVFAVEVTGIEPSLGVEAGGLTVTITGTDFEDGATVAFGETAADVTFGDATSLTAVSPPGMGEVNVVVTNPDGEESEPQTFTYESEAPPDEDGEADEDGEEMPDEDGEEMPDEDGEEMPDEDGEEMPDEDGEEMPDEDGEEMPDEDGEEMPDEDGEEMPDEDGEEMPDEDGEEMPDEDADETTFSITPVGFPSVGPGESLEVVITGDGFQGLNRYLITLAVEPAEAFDLEAATFRTSDPAIWLSLGVSPTSIGTVEVGAFTSGDEFSGDGFEFGTFTLTTADDFVAGTAAEISITQISVRTSVGTELFDSFPAIELNTFEFEDPPPAVTGIAPASGIEAGGQPVTLTGADFQEGATVTFGETAASDVMVMDAMTLTAVPPPGTAGAVEVVVTNPDGQTSEPQTFTYVASPTVTSIAPASGIEAGGLLVTLTGTGFVEGATVTFGETAAPDVIFGDATTLTAIFPPGTGAVEVVVTNPDGQSSEPQTFTYGVPPTVTGIAPASGIEAGGLLVTLTGTGFVEGATVTFGETAAPDVIFGDATTLTAIFPPGTAGAVEVVVTNPDGQTSEPQTFAYLASPTVTGIEPASGIEAGGQSVTLTGADFQEGATVTFGETAASDVMVMDAMTLTAVSPPGMAGAVEVVVTNPDGQTSEPQTFTYVAPPAVTSIAPASGIEAGGQSVTFTGADFQEGATVTFGETASDSVTFGDATTLTAVSPPGMAGAVNVVVTNPDEQTSEPQTFTYVAPPAVTSIAPALGIEAGGLEVTFTGADFQEGATVAFGETAASDVMVMDAMTLTAVSPPGMGMVEVVVTNPDEQSSEPQTFTYVASPAVTSIAPASGIEAGGQSVTFTGADFQEGATVTFGETASDSVTFGDAMTLTAVSPPGMGMVEVVVTNPDEQSSEPQTFTYVAPPAVTSIAPASGIEAGGLEVTFTGADFQEGATVTFGETASDSVTFGDAMTLTAVSPPGTAGAVEVVVTNPDEQSSEPQTFTYVVPLLPILTSIDPVSGIEAGGQSVTLTGADFQEGATVAFGETASDDVTFGDATTLTAVSPPGTAGEVNVVVTNPGGQTSEPQTFTYVVPPPAVTSIAPASGFEIGGQSVTLTGADFQEGATVTFGETAASDVMVMDAMNLTAVSPPGTAGEVNVVVTNPDEQSSEPQTFTYIASVLPVLTSIDPVSGFTIGGQLVTLIGADFQEGATVAFGETASDSVTFGDATTLTAVSPPAGALLDHDHVEVVVTNPGGESSEPQLFTYVVPPPPILTGIEPVSGFEAGGLEVTITGEDFLEGATVTFGDSSSAVTFVDAMTLTAISSPGTGAVEVVVTNPDGQTSGSQTFTYLASPTVTGIAPAEGVEAGGLPVTLTGENFEEGATVTFGDSSSAVTFVDSTTLTTVSPPGMGAVEVVVTNPDGQPSKPQTFTYVSPPTVTSIDPALGIEAGGQPVTLTGADFVDGATVKFGETASLDVIFWDATTLTAVSPPGMEGMVAVVVTNPDGQSSEPQTFTYGVLQLGDANGDGFVSLKDAIRILRFVSGEDVEIAEAVADVNGIAGVSAGDALRVMRFISGLAEFEHPSSQ